MEVGTGSHLEDLSGSLSKRLKTSPSEMGQKDERLQSLLAGRKYGESAEDV